MIRLGCHSWLFAGLPLGEAAARARRLGFDLVDLGAGRHLDPVTAAADPTSTGQHIRQALAAAGVGLADAFPVLLYPALNGPRAVERVGQLRGLAACVAAAGSPSLSVSPGVCQDDGFGPSWARSVQALRALVAVAGEHGLVPRVELHFDSVANTPERAHRLLAEVPGLTLLFNPAHWEMQAIPYADVRPLIAHASHVHLRPARPGKIATSLAWGTLDLDQVVRDLVAAGYDGALCLGSAPRAPAETARVWAASFADHVADPEAEVLRLRERVERLLATTA